MKIEDLFIELKMRVERNNSNNGISLDKSRFVRVFNAAQMKFIDNTLKKKNDESIRDIQKLLITDYKLSESSKVKGKVIYSLPNNFYSYSNFRASVSNSTCNVNDFIFWEAKSENVHLLLADEFNKPSFKYRESFYTIGNNDINVYVDDFNISSAYLTYYRYPQMVNMSGMIDQNGIPTIDKDCEFDDKIAMRILDIATKEFNQNEGDLQKYSTDKDRVLSDK